MNEKIFFSLATEAGNLPINEFSKGGVVLNQETSAWPRGTRIALRPGGRAAEERYKTLAKLRDWRDGQFLLDVGHVGDEIRISESEGGSLSAVWDFRIRVEDLKCGGFRRVILPKNGQASLAIRIKQSRRRVDVQLKNQWDSEVRDVIERTRLDESEAMRWLRNQNGRASRKSCLLNILAVCRDLSLTRYIEAVVLADVDRVYARVEPGLFDSLDDERFTAEGPPGHSTHRRLVKWVTTREGHANNDYSTKDLRSFRQKQNPSLQVVTLPPSAPGKPHYAEFDIDFGNIYSLPGLIIHIGEVLLPDRTDHFKVFKKLSKIPGIAQYLVYEPHEK